MFKAAKCNLKDDKVLFPSCTSCQQDLENLAFLIDFVQVCSEGAKAGFHERNGGNLSYVLSTSESDELLGLLSNGCMDLSCLQDLSQESLRKTKSYLAPEKACDEKRYANTEAIRDFSAKAGYETNACASRLSWQALHDSFPGMANRLLLITASGSYLKNVERDLSQNVGVVLIDSLGENYCILWGFSDASKKPSSELSAHVASHEKRLEKTPNPLKMGSALYHAHPASLVVFTALLPPDARTYTRALWACFTESIIAFPGGLGALPWMVPGSKELALATARALSSFDACLWPLHGVCAAGCTCDEAFALVQAIDKAAEIYIRLHSQNPMSEKTVYSLSNDDLRATALAYKLPINEAFL